MTTRTTIFFDGNCNLCNGIVRFIKRRMPRDQIQLKPLQFADAASTASGSDGVQEESLILVQNEKVYTMSTAALRVMMALGWPWRMLGLLLAIPAPIRDWVYRWIARNRYRWFGKTQVCDLPTDRSTKQS